MTIHNKLKYLLIPITMTLWYFVTYYGLYFSIIGFTVLFSLNWFVLIIGYLFLISLFYVIFISLPSLLRYFIIKFYGLTWFSIISHWLAGIIAVIDLVLLFINSPPEIVNAPDNGFFLTTMFNISPFKTTLLFMPFLALSIVLLWSTIFIPIQAKLTPMNNENNSSNEQSDEIDQSNKDNQSYEELQYKAAELIDSSRILVAIIRPQLLKNFPELYLVQETEKFNIYATIAFSQIVCIQLHAEVEKEYRTKLELIVQQEIYEMYENALVEYKDLAYVIRNRILNEKDRTKRRKYIHYISCLWILKKIGFVENIDTPNEKGIEVAQYLSDLFENESAGYWTRN